MKKLSIFKSLLLTGLFCLLGSGSLWAYDISAKCLYFDNTDAKWTIVCLYGWGSNWSSGVDLTQVSGTNYWTDNNAFNSYNGFLLKNESGKTFSDNVQKSNDYTENVTSPICYHRKSDGTWEKVAVGVQNVGITNSSSILSGNGTENDPYIVASGSKITVTLSGSLIASTNHTISYSAALVSH